MWETEIIPHWDEKHHLKKTYELSEEGIPSKVRGKVWLLAIGNDLNITEELYDICVNRAKKSLKVDSKVVDNSDFVGKEDTLELIVTDLSRTFPSLGIFQVNIFFFF